MKRLSIILLAVLLLTALTVLPAFATAGGSAAADSVTGAPGEQVEVTLSLSGFTNVDSIAVHYTIPEGLTMVESKWLIPGNLKGSDTGKNQSVWACSDKQVLENTPVFSLVLQVQEPAAGKAEVSWDVVFSAMVSENYQIAGDPVRATGKVTVSHPATGVTLPSTFSMDMSKSKTASLKAIVTPTNAIGVNLQWKSSDPSVVSVDAKGVLTAHKTGTAKITVSSGSLSCTSTVTVSCTHSFTDYSPSGNGISTAFCDHGCGKTDTVQSGLASIKVTKNPTKTSYLEGKDNKLKLAGGELTLTYENGDTKKIALDSTGVSATGLNANKVGTQTITVTYGGKKATFQVTVKAKSLTAVAIESKPTKLSYIAGQSLSLDGGKLKLTYDNGTQETVKMDDLKKVSGFNSKKTGSQTVTYAYNKNFKVTFQVSVAAKVVTKLSVKTPPKTTEYLEGKSLNLAGGVLNVTYNDGQNTTVAMTDAVATGYDANKVGKQTVTVTYGGKTATFTVEVKAKSLTGITISKAPTKATYLEGEKLDTTGLTVSAGYNNGTSANVTGWTVSGFDTNKVGKQTITVTYGGKTATFTVEVKAKSLTGITVSKAPTKVTYLEGQKLDTTGLTVKASYNNGTSADVTGWAVSGYNANKVGKQTVTVTYGGKTATFTVEVTAKSLTGISISGKPTKLSYLTGEKLDTTGMKVTASYNNGTSANVTGWTVSGYDANKVGAQTVTVTYGGKTATFTVTVSSSAPSTITSKTYSVTDTRIRKIPHSTTVAKLLDGITEVDYCVIYKADGSEPKAADAVGTGMVVKLMDGKTVKQSKTVVVTGDVNGDGKITITDMISAKSHILKKSNLTGAYGEAGDTNADGKITITDFIQLKAHILGKSAVTAN